jgi:von Willebrand factor type A domain
LSNLVLLLGIASFIAWLGSRDRPADRTERDSDEVESIATALQPPESAGTSRDGIAAILMIDASGSMRESIREQAGSRPKIDVARDAALVLVRRFGEYAKAHPDEPVVVGVMEFSEREPSNTRSILSLGPPDPDQAERALQKIQTGGGTPIGDAIVAGKHGLDVSGMSRRHLIVVTDGENTDGYEPEDVLKALARRPEAERPSVYFVAFDIAASRFDAVRDSGGLVLGAANGEELDSTLNSLLNGKILVESP